jgi:hypothetical protein
MTKSRGSQSLPERAPSRAPQPIGAARKVVGERVGTDLEMEATRKTC